MSASGAAGTGAATGLARRCQHGGAALTGGAHSAGERRLLVSGRRPRLAWSLVLVSTALTASAWIIAWHDGPGRAGVTEPQQVQQALMALTFPVLGALLATTSPRNRLAWTFAIIGVTRGGALAARAWALHDYAAGGHWAVPGLFANVSIAMLFTGPLLAPLTLLWFPDGRGITGRWRYAYAFPVLAAVGLLALLAAAASVPGRSLVDDSAAPAGLASVGLAGFLVGTGGGLLVGLASLIFALRHTDLVVRQQVKWYLFGGTVAVALNTAGDVLPGASALNLVGTLAFEIAILVAVRRYALWDIDRVLRRTVVYGVLSVGLAAVYVGTVIGLGLVLSEVSFHRDLDVAAATLASAALIGPGRAALQSRVDRRFDRRRYEAVRRVREHGDRIAAHPNGPEELQQLLREVLGDPGLLLRFAVDDAVLDLAGQPVTEPFRSERQVTTQVSDHATLLHHPVPSADQPLFSAVIEAAAGPASIARLQARLLVQLADVKRSRRRIVEAADDQRRRIERDLHDGAQQRLVALAMRLRSEQRRHASDLSPTAQAMVDYGVMEISGSVADLRALAAGILPGSLVTEGLGPALGELTDRSPTPVTGVRDLDHRHDPHVEATAWFVAAEALANSLKHAPGAAVSLSVSCDGSILHLTVEDDGPGGASEGGGLLGLDDRVRACAGTLVVDSPPGVGTRLSAALPCG